VRWGTTPRQETLTGTLGTIAGLVAQKSFKPPAVIVIGEVVRLRDELNWFEKRPLLGRRVVVTRTRRQASRLVERLALLGADVLEIPTIRIVPTTLTPPEAALMENIGDRFDWLVFASPNGVERFFEEFHRMHDDIRALGAIKIAAIGPATAAKIAARNLKIDLQPDIYTAEELGRCFDKSLAQGRRFCLAQGRLADPGLYEHLKTVGADTVEKIILYETVPETVDMTGARARFESEGADFITFTSSSTVENWHALNLQPSPGQPQPRPVSLGPVTSATLRRLGYENVAEAKTATIPALVETMIDLL
jgi:uroporphyrinogen III methyltransferase/synthase